MTDDKKPKKPRKKRTPAAGVPKRDSDPALRDSSPALRDSDPALRDSDPALRDSDPALRDSSPALRDSSPAIRESSPVIRESSPVIEIVPDEVSAAVAMAAASLAHDSDASLVAAAKLAANAAAPVPGAAPMAAPEPVAHAETMPTPAAVPVAIEPSLAEPVAAPLEVARTKPLELPKREPSLPTQPPPMDGSPADSKAESNPESKAESKAESNPESKAESKTETNAESKAESNAESKAESKIESKAESKAESKIESKAETNAESKAESKIERAPSEAKADRIIAESRAERTRADSMPGMPMRPPPPARAPSQPPADRASQPPADRAAPADRASPQATNRAPSQPPADRASQPPADRASQPPADRASQPPADRASQPTADRASQPPADRASQPVLDARRRSEPTIDRGAPTEPPPMMSETVPLPPIVEPSSVPVVPLPPVLPSPAEAALEAARVVSQMVDIDSESGAVIAAAAAAGAAIEAAMAAQKAAAAGPVVGVVPPPASEPPPALSDLAAGTHDPVTTVRLSRDRILRALADEPAASADGVAPTRQPRARTEPGLPRDSATNIPIRARTEPGIEGGDDFGEFDPVAIAAAAIGRLRQRARTDLAELRVHYHRHDVIVLLLAFVMIVVAGRIHARLVTPEHKTFDQHGLVFEHPAGWLVTDNVPLPAARLVHEETNASKDEALYHAELTESGGGTGKLEVLIDKKPAWSNIVTGLELDRRTRWGELYRLDDSSVRSIAGHDWLRTEYRYAHAEKDDVPRVDHAVEFATIDRDQLYVITAFGTPGELSRLEDIVEPSLRVASQTGLPLVPQTTRVAQGKYPTNVARGFDSTVMVVVADLENGRLRAKGGGSGVIVGADGSILTNYHVIHDKENRLHEIFVIGRFSKPDEAPQLQCAGHPNRSKLQPELDLALIKCDMDLDGRTWNPTSAGGIWATLAEARASDIKMGQRLFVLGYPDVGGGGLTMSEGEVEGWTGEDGTQGRDFIKTDASITHGNSGGPVVDDQGKLVGVASAFRTKVSANGNIVETAQIGLVRPLGAASDLLAIAAAGWTPREHYTDVELTPTAVEAAAEGVRIYTTVLDDATETPIRDALVMVLKPGINTATIDMNRLDDQTIAWGKTNGNGEVRLKQLVPVPGNYTVMVIAPGYEPLIGENELHLDDKTPPSFDPWGKIGLRSR